MENNNEFTLEIKYNELLDRNKKTNSILGIFPYSSGGELKKIFLIVVLSSIIEFFLPTFYLNFLLTFLFCLNYINLYGFRERAICHCIVEETYLNSVYKEKGVDPNFPNDPLYVTEGEREFILEDFVYANVERKNLFKKIKDHYIFSIMILSYFLIYIVIKQSLH